MGIKKIFLGILAANNLYCATPIADLAREYYSRLGHEALERKLYHAVDSALNKLPFPTEQNRWEVYNQAATGLRKLVLSTDPSVNKIFEALALLGLELDARQDENTSQSILNESQAEVLRRQLPRLMQLTTNDPGINTWLAQQYPISLSTHKNKEQQGSSTEPDLIEKANEEMAKNVPIYEPNTVTVKDFGITIAVAVIAAIGSIGAASAAAAIGYYYKWKMVTNALDFIRDVGLWFNPFAMHTHAMREAYNKNKQEFDTQKPGIHVTLNRADRTLERIIAELKGK